MVPGVMRRGWRRNAMHGDLRRQPRGPTAPSLRPFRRLTRLPDPRRRIADAGDGTPGDVAHPTLRRQRRMIPWHDGVNAVVSCRFLFAIWKLVLQPIAVIADPQDMAAMDEAAAKTQSGCQ